MTLRRLGASVPFVGGMLAAVFIVPALIVARSISRKPDVGTDGYLYPIEDYYHFWAAGRAMLNGGDIFAGAPHQNYIYPPIVAWIFQPLAMIEQRPGVYLWLAIDVAVLAGGAILFARELARRLQLPGGWATALAATLIAALCILDKIQAQYKLQQTDGVMLLAMAAALHWLERKPWASGVLLGFSGNIKYLSLIVLPWFGLRRKWAALLTTAGTFIAFLFIPALTRGWSRNMEDVKVAFAGITSIFDAQAAARTASASHPITWERSVSVTSTFFRLADAMHASGVVAVGLIAITGLACLAAAWWLYSRAGMCFFGTTDQRREVVGMEWVGLVVASLVFGPQTTNRHMIQLIALFILAALLVLRGSPAVRRLPIVACGLLVALGLVLPPGGEGNSAVFAWRAVGGVSWLTLIFLFVTLQQTLNHCRTLPRSELSSA